jgi:hypothetical protein
MPDAVDTVIRAPDDGWRYHPKNVEQFTDINKLYIDASCWTIIDIRYSLLLQCDRYFIRSLAGNRQCKCPSTSKLFNDVGCIGKGKGPIKQPVTETKVKFDCLLFAVQENQQDKLLAIKRAAIDRAQNLASSLDV